MTNSVYRIEATADTPLFEIDRDKHYMKIKGVSMPENPFEFYDPIEKATLDTYSNHKEPLVLDIELSYMNSMSNKQLLKLIKQLFSKTPTLNVVWKYAKGDTLMKIKGEEIAILCSPLKVTVEEI